MPFTSLHHLTNPAFYLGSGGLTLTEKGVAVFSALKKIKGVYLTLLHTKCAPHSLQNHQQES